MALRSISSLGRSCAKNSHECIVGLISGEHIKKSCWENSLKVFRDKVKYFNESKKAIPHPGKVEKFEYCVECGCKIEGI